MRNLRATGPSPARPAVTLIEPRPRRIDEEIDEFAERIVGIRHRCRIRGRAIDAREEKIAVAQPGRDGRDVLRLRLHEPVHVDRRAGLTYGFRAVDAAGEQTAVLFASRSADQDNFRFIRRGKCYGKGLVDRRSGSRTPAAGFEHPKHGAFDAAFALHRIGDCRKLCVQPLIEPNGMPFLQLVERNLLQFIKLDPGRLCILGEHGHL